jgi:hypothetical protein
MLLTFVVAVLGLGAAGLAVFVWMCVAIRIDDKSGLPAQPPSLAAGLTRRFVGLSGQLGAIERVSLLTTSMTSLIIAADAGPGPGSRLAPNKRSSCSV